MSDNRCEWDTLALGTRDEKKGSKRFNALGLQDIFALC